MAGTLEAILKEHPGQERSQHAVDQCLVDATSLEPLVGRRVLLGEDTADPTGSEPSQQEAKRQLASSATRQRSQRRDRRAGLAQRVAQLDDRRTVGHTEPGSEAAQVELGEVESPTGLRIGRVQ